VQPLDFAVRLKGRNVSRLVEDWEAQLDTLMSEADLVLLTEDGDRLVLEGA
jgi:hypothetical protein